MVCILALGLAGVLLAGHFPWQSLSLTVKPVEIVDDIWCSNSYWNRNNQHHEAIFDLPDSKDFASLDVSEHQPYSGADGDGFFGSTISRLLLSRSTLCQHSPMLDALNTDMRFETIFEVMLPILHGNLSLLTSIVVAKCSNPQVERR